MNLTERFTCRECGGKMLLTESGLFLLCENFCGKLHPIPKARELPLAERINSRKFRIEGRRGEWKYVPYAHKEALTKPPESGTVVARVATRVGAQARVFRECGDGRGKAVGGA